MVYLVLTALCFNKSLNKCLNFHFAYIITALTPTLPPCTPTPYNYSETFTKHSSRENVHVHEKGRTNNNIVLNKVDTTENQNFYIINKGSSHS